MKKIFSSIKKYADVKTVVLSCIFGFLMALSFVLGRQLDAMGMTLPGISGKAKIVVKSLMLMIPIAAVSFPLFVWLCTFRSKDAKVKTKRLFLVSFLIIALARIPVFLAYYPAVMSYDFGRQIDEAMKGHIWFWDYQPLIHTELIRIFYLIGVKLGSIETGMALLSLFQILVLSLVLSYSVCLVVRISGRLWIGTVLILIYAFLPLHELITVIMTKDVLFSAFFLLFICLIYERSLKKSALLDIAIILTAILNIMFRKNSVYAMVVLIPCFFIYEKKFRDKILSSILIVLCIASGLACQNAMVVGFDVIRANSREMYSVPMMQVMRAYTYQKDNLTQEQYDMFYRLLPLEEERLHYDPYVADCVKNYMDRRSDIWDGSPKAFLHDWITIGKTYPNDYIDAFLMLTRGYWYLPDRIFAEVFGVGADIGKGILHTYNPTDAVIEGGIKETCYIPAVRRAYEQIINENGFFDWPVLNLLFRPAFYFWIIIFAAFLSFRKKNRIMWILLTYPVVYMMTLFFGPLVYIRYMYPEILAVPVLLAAAVFLNPGRADK